MSKKTHYMIFSLSRNLIINDTDIKMNGQMVARVACTKLFYLMKNCHGQTILNL